MWCRWENRAQTSRYVVVTPGSMSYPPPRRCSRLDATESHDAPRSSVSLCCCFNKKKHDVLDIRTHERMHAWPARPPPSCSAVAALKVAAVDAPVADGEDGAALAAVLAGRKVCGGRVHDVADNGRVLAGRRLLLRGLPGLLLRRRRGSRRRRHLEGLRERAGRLLVGSRGARGRRMRRVVRRAAGLRVKVHFCGGRKLGRVRKRRRQCQRYNKGEECAVVMVTRRAGQSLVW
jgi:hypothetical protein